MGKSLTQRNMLCIHADLRSSLLVRLTPPPYRWFKALILFNIKKNSVNLAKRYINIVFRCDIKYLILSSVPHLLRHIQAYFKPSLSPWTQTCWQLTLDIWHTLVYTLLIQVSRTILTIHRQWIILLQNSSSYCSGKQQHCVTAPCFIKQLNVILRK